ncbi:MAG: hypothetical protein CMO55_05615 [Verrucomicrobiales bacterium]|nr:hypothetical protein [Verrucomicrobiales bacterium]
MNELAKLKPVWVGLWINRKSSLLRIFDLKAVTEGTNRTHYRIKGAYQTGVGRPDSTTRFPVTGFVTGDQIVFTVSFRVADNNREDDEPKDAMTAWAGQIMPDQENCEIQTLQTLWHLTRNVVEGEDDTDPNPEKDHGWASLLAGADTFRKISDDPNASPPTLE